VIHLQTGVVLAALGLLSAACATDSSSRRVLSKSEAAEYHVRIGSGALSEGDVTGALIEFDQAEKLDNTNPELHHAKGLAYFKRGDLDIAAKCVERALELRPDFSDAQNTLGKILSDQGHLAEAESYLRKAAADPLYRDSYKPLTNLGVNALHQGNPARASEFFDRAIRLGATRACAAYYYRGNIRLEQGDVPGSLDDYDRAAMFNCGNFPEAHLAKGVALARAKRYDDARKKFLDVAKLFPKTDAARKAAEQLRYLP